LCIGLLNGLDGPLDLVSFAVLIAKVNKYSANYDYYQSYYCKLRIKCCILQL